MPELDVDFLGAYPKTPPTGTLRKQFLLESSIAPVRYPFKCLWIVAENSLDRCVVPEIKDIAWNIVLWYMLFSRHRDDLTHRK
jgi:hypothetical protein